MIDIIILLITFFLMAGAIFGFSNINNSRYLPIMGTISLILLGFGFLFGNLILVNERNKPIIIKKSSDSDWELSNDYSIKSDTCITEIRIVNGVDTVYPTTCYKILRYGTE